MADQQSRSAAAVRALAEMDPQFAVLVETLFGKAIDPMDVWDYVYTPEGVSKMLAAGEVAKANPDQADLHVASGVLQSTGRRRRKKLVDDVHPIGKTYRGRRSSRPRGTFQRVAETTDQLHTVTDDLDKVREEKKLLEAKKQAKPKVAKSETEAEVEFDVEIAKVDDDKHQVFGWASVVKKSGVTVVDRQGDWITPEDIEKAAYSYVVKSRKGGNQHQRTETDEPKHVSDMIESFVVTPEKIEKMALPETTPLGWWVGFQINDEDTWHDIKDKRKVGFSVHGRGKRVEMEPA